MNMALFSEYTSDEFRLIWSQFESTLKTAKSRNLYRYYVNWICDFCKKDFLDIDAKLAHKYFFSLEHADKKYSVKYLHSMLSAYISIANFIILHRDVFEKKEYENPFLSIVLGEYTDNICVSAIPTEKSIQKILSASKKADTQLYLIFALAFFCSLTVSEIIRLTFDDFIVDQNNNIGLHISARTNVEHDRYVKIPSMLFPELNKLGMSAGTRKFFFVNSYGRPLQTRTVQTNVSAFMKTLGLPKPYTLQQIRNASVVYMRIGGATSSDVAKYTGVSERWMYRYDGVIDELILAPCDLISVTA